MKQVMISELKAHLSEVLRAVKAGETYVVRDRGVPVAQVVSYVDEDEPDIIEPTLPPTALRDSGRRDPSLAWVGVEGAVRARDEEDRFTVREPLVPLSELRAMQPIDIGDPGAALRALLANRDEEDR